jgi:hypothetical protein
MIWEMNDCNVCEHKEVCKKIDTYKDCIEAMRARDDQSKWDKFAGRIMCQHYIPGNSPRR